MTHCCKKGAEHGGCPGNHCSNYFPGEPHEPILALDTLKSAEHTLLHPRVCNPRVVQAAQHRVQGTFLAAGEEGSLPGTAPAPFGEQKIFALQIISRESCSGG